VVICLERGADLHTAELMPLPLTVSYFSKIQIGFTFLVPAYPGSPGQRAVKRMCVYYHESLQCAEPWTPLGDFRSPDPLCPPPPNPGYATARKHCLVNSRFTSTV